jgi:hypothetical protein
VLRFHEHRSPGFRQVPALVSLVRSQIVLISEDKDDHGFVCFVSYPMLLYSYTKAKRNFLYFVKTNNAIEFAFLVEHKA